MPFIDQLNEPLLQTYLEPLILLLLPAARDDRDAAMASARNAVICYDPQSLAEFTLVCQLAVFSMQAAYTAARAGSASLPPADVARLCKAATAFAREAEKVERRLEKLRSPRGKDDVLQSCEVAPTEAKPPEAKPPEAEPPEAEPAKQDAVETNAAEQKPSKASTQIPVPVTKKQETRLIAAYAREFNLTFAQAWTAFELEKKRQRAEVAGQP